MTIRYARDFRHLNLAVGIVEPGDPGVADFKSVRRRDFAMLRVGPIDDNYFLVPAESTRPHDLDRLTRDDKIPAIAAGTSRDMDDCVDPILVLVDRQGAQFLVDMIRLDQTPENGSLYFISPSV